MKCFKISRDCFKATLFVSIFFILIWLLTDIFIILHDNESLPKNDVCTSVGCKQSVLLYNKFMNLNADPCEDFYEFTCGNFVKNTIIPDDKSSVNIFENIDDIVINQIRNILVEPIKKDEIEPFKLAKSLYQACINEANIENQGITTLFNVFTLTGTWPVLMENWNEENFNWIDTVINLGKLGYSTSSILNIAVDLDIKNNTNRMLSIDQGLLLIHRDFLNDGMKNEIVQAYFEYMVKVAVHLGANETRAKEDLMESLYFEMELANVSLSVQERSDMNKLYNLISINNLQQEYPSIPWLQFINDLLPSNIQITKNETVINIAPNYVKYVENLLQRTPKYTIANYIFWGLVHQSIPYLTRELRNIQFEFNSKLSGKTQQNPRWKNCAFNVEDSLQIALSSLYIRKHFNQDSKRQMEELVHNLRNEFKNILRNIDWMDEKTKNNALEKIDTIHAFIGYPDELLDDNKLISYYQNLTIDKNFYLESMLKLTRFLKNKSFNELREPFNKTKWTRHSQSFVVNAFYSASENSIELPAAILQILLFSNDRPNYLNYGSIGFVIGHELTHGFDNFGRQFDKNGNLLDWWEPSTNEKFINKSQCFIHQYRNYSIENINLNGINTQSENIADNGGIKIAYRAYNNWLKTHNAEPKLENMNFTQKQMFWISSGSVWCTKYRNEYLKVFLSTNSHSPGSFRVNGVVSNQKEFSEDFNCPLGSKMNPVNKCEVW